MPQILPQSCKNTKVGEINNQAHKLGVIDIMAERVVKFLSRGYKIRKIFAWESKNPKEIIEFWVLD